MLMPISEIGGIHTMNNYILSCCSTVDLSPELLTKLEIPFVCFHYSLADKHYLDDMGSSLSYNQFYKALTEGAEARSSQVNIDEYISFFTPFLEQGKDILHISFSSGLSGSFHSACIAAQMLEEDFPDRRLLIVDSLAASAGYGMLMTKLASLRDSGMDIESLHAWVEENKLRLNHWFFSTDLTHYIRGGRITKTAGTVATMLGICPLLHMDDNGKLIPVEKIRSKKHVMNGMVSKMEQYADKGTDYGGTVFLSHSDCEEDAEAVAALVSARFPKLAAKPSIFSVGTVIGCHTGPGTVALFFWGKDRREK